MDSCRPGEHNFQLFSTAERIFCSKCGSIRGADLTEGVIVLWSGGRDSIPAGWVLCDGTKGTPDLRDKFIVGACGAYNVGTAGGKANCKLTLQNIPSHTHYRNTEGKVELPIVENVLRNDNPESKCVVRRDGNERFYSDYSNATKTVYDTPKMYTTTGSSLVKDPLPIETLPPYYALAYIMRKDKL